jgi:hypothetical protein
MEMCEAVLFSLYSMPCVHQFMGGLEACWWFVPGISGQGSLVVDSSNHWLPLAGHVHARPTWLPCLSLLPQIKSNQTDDLVFLCL